MKGIFSLVLLFSLMIGISIMAPEPISAGVHCFTVEGDTTREEKRACVT